MRRRAARRRRQGPQARERVGAPRRALTRPSTDRRLFSDGQVIRSLARSAPDIGARFTKNCARVRRSNLNAVLACVVDCRHDHDTGREQPSGAVLGTDTAQNRGVAHAPAPSVTLAKCVSCAAQNAALVVRPLARTRRCGKTCDRNPSRILVHRSSVSTDNLALPTAPTTAFCHGSPRGVSRFRIGTETRGEGSPKTRRFASEMPSDSDRLVARVCTWRRSAMTPFQRGVSDLGCGRGHDRQSGQISWSLTPRSPFERSSAAARPRAAKTAALSLLSTTHTVVSVMEWSEGSLPRTEARRPDET